MEQNRDNVLSDKERISSLEWRVEDLENQLQAMRNIPWAVAQLSGMVVALQEMVSIQIKGSRDEPECEDNETSKWKAVIHFLAVVVVPIAVAAITGYFALRTAGK